MSCSSAVSNATLSENSFYVGINTQNILYGIQLGLYFKTMHVFLSRRKQRWKSDLFYVVSDTVVLLLITIRVASDGLYGQKMWLIDRKYPGGPLAYGESHSSDVYMDLGMVAVVILQQMIDVFMVYRCRIIWDDHLVILVPSTLWLANLALGIMVSQAITAPGTDFFSGVEDKLALAYNLNSVILNAMLTCMIWYRLMCHARTARVYHGRRYVSPYFTIEALVVESALPYTLSGIVLLVSYGLESETGIAFSCVYTLMMCVSSQMLILRVAEGKAWQRNTMCSVCVLSPERGGSSGAEHSDGSGAVALHLETLPSRVYLAESSETNK